ncbi:DUF5709 domain-containing protein [Nocardioides sp. BP30]|uniref:DUF5709 domain-containing protein n=1 Tax=Nocardioides sp. BP30 TaxID=3036374 RepID=UPI0024699C7A|nr:DUF5709 domain-containing protein [Nocardioides sp. BP30]WGL51763.1 DUF5709 domain-containing protein [Nocardioides sp. BP30]
MTEERESYGDYSVDDEDQPGAEGDQASDPGREPDDELDPGYSPPEKWSAAEGYGNTPWEEAQGESLDQRIRQEEPEADPYAETDDDLDEGDENREVGDRRAGRLVDPDQGYGEDTEKDLVGWDAGIDGAGASAEEAAVHVVLEEDLDDDLDEDDVEDE